MMPPIVLVLGANGTLGVAVCHLLLLNRFTVHAQVRNIRTIETLNNLSGAAGVPAESLHIIHGDPSSDNFWVEYGSLLNRMNASCAFIDEAEARYRVIDSLEKVDTGEGPIVVAVVSCTGNLINKPVHDTTPEDIIQSMLAHVMPVQQSIRYMPVLSGNRYCSFIAVGSDPLSWEGTIDCCSYCIAKFALRGLMDCAKHDMPYAYFETVYPKNYESRLWSRGGIECPFAETTAEQVASKILEVIRTAIQYTKDRIMAC